ncbi:HAD-IC family P-type ATPase [Candidatus Woesearchaeota archaeon]|nr:HAD-IC family P-type ATPase [Candidatus Woesearchaeota archaeon]
MENYHCISPDEVIKGLSSSASNGLSSPEAQSRLEKYGKNELPKSKKLTAVILFLNQFKDTMIILLFVAGMISLVLGERVEAIAIFGILLLNAILGFVQEYRAEKAMEALEKLSTPHAKVIRDGKEQVVLAKELVPGDIVIIEAGDNVPADMRIIEVSSLEINEASLTGESLPSKKVVEAYCKPVSVADQENMAFAGTAVTYGKGKCVVISTGLSTEFGKIAASLHETSEVKTPLQEKFTKLAKQIGIVVVFLVAAVFITGFIQGILSVEKMLLFALALTVSTIPNSLPLVVTVSLSMGANRLAKKNMLVKKLPAAESLGAATFICTDKTGTLTKNQMTVTRIFTNNSIISVTGSGYTPVGEFYKERNKKGKNGKQGNNEDQGNNDKIYPKQLSLLLRIGYLCNNAKLVKKDGNFEIIGDPTEGSLVVLGEKGGLKEEELLSSCSQECELPFDSDRKRMSTVYFDKGTKQREAYVKGAPDLLLKACKSILDKGKVRALTKKDRQLIMSMNNSFAAQALRVLALAYRKVPKGIKPGKCTIANIEKDLVFVGLVGMIDPPRDEVKDAIARCYEAGIKVMVITGDHPITTKAVAQQIGLFSEGDIVLTGDEVENMSDDELQEKVEGIRIIARAMPIQKLRIVEALQKKGHVVAMTGDGVNDAPALKKADIGIAMGITGTDVAKEVSKAVLEDDNFASIVNAIEEGRNIYDKMIKSVKFFLSCNSGEITSVFVAIMIGLPLPMLPLQILMMNLLTDNFPALGLGFESSEENIMKRKPRNPKENPITKQLFMSIIFFGLIMGLGTLLLFNMYRSTDLAKAQTVAFTTLVMFQMFAVMSSRTLHHSIKHLNPFSNPWLLGGVSLSIAIQLIVIYLKPFQAIFGTVPLLLLDWVLILGMASTGFVLMELSKFVVKS